MRARSSWATEPWWARAISRGAVTISSEGFIMSAGGRPRLATGGIDSACCADQVSTPSVSSPPWTPTPAARSRAQAQAWSSLSLAVSFSAILRELTNTSVDWWAMMVA